MSIKEDAKSILKTFRITETMEKALEELNIDFAETCRQALQGEIDFLNHKKGRPSHGGKIDSRSR